MNKILVSDLVKLMNQKGHNEKITYQYIKDLFEIIGEEVTKGNSVGITGFGRFSPFTSKPKKFHLNDTSTILPQRTTIKFIPSKVLKEKINDGV